MLFEYKTNNSTILLNFSTHKNVIIHNEETVY